MDRLKNLTTEELERKLSGLQLKFNSEIDKADRLKRMQEERRRAATEAWMRIGDVKKELARRK